MAKISDITAYPNQSPVALTDYLIGTDNTTKATKTFTVQDLANAIDDQVSLQEVLTVGNTDGGVGMSVTGASSFGNLTLTGTLTAGGGVGTAGQFLSSTGTAIQWVNPYAPSGTQYTLAMFDTTSSIGNAMVSQNAAGTEMTFGSASTGASLDMQQNKLVFASDATNTFIQADSATPESLEIHADNDINLLADRHVIINGTVPAGPSSTGVRGAIIYDNDYIYVCVQTDTWKRVAISSW